MKTYNADHLDGVRDGNTSSMFYRDKSRGQHGSEHTLFFHGANVQPLVEKYQFRTEHNSSYETGLSFADNAAQQCTADAATATTKTVRPASLSPSPTCSSSRLT